MTSGTSYTPPPAFGRFRLLHQIGAGVLGPVFRTHDPDGDRLVAVKAFTLDITPEQANTLASEFQRVVDLGLEHPHIAALVGTGVEEFVAYLAVQYVAGESLDAAIRQYGPAPAVDAVRLVSHVAEALDAAARVGVFHGSLHPRDILVTPGETHVTGLGAAKALERIGLHGPIRRPYVAPERENGEEWGAAVDVFSLAAIGYEVLTGRRALPGTDQPLPGLNDLRVHDAGALREVIEAGLDPDPERRPNRAADFAAAFAAALVDGGVIPATGERLAGHRHRKPRSRAPKLPGLDEPLITEESAVSVSAPAQAPAPTEDVPASRAQASPTPAVPTIVSTVPAAELGVEPAAVEPAAIEPIAIESAAIEPVAVEPAAIEPEAVEPTAIGPAAIEPIAVEPAAIEPVAMTFAVQTVTAIEPESQAVPGSVIELPLESDVAVLPVASALVVEALDSALPTLDEPLTPPTEAVPPVPLEPVRKRVRRAKFELAPVAIVEPEPAALPELESAAPQEPAPESALLFEAEPSVRELTYEPVDATRPASRETELAATEPAAEPDAPPVEPEVPPVERGPLPVEPEVSTLEPDAPPVAPPAALEEPEAPPVELDVPPVAPEAESVEPAVPAAEPAAESEALSDFSDLKLAYTPDARQLAAAGFSSSPDEPAREAATAEPPRRRTVVSRSVPIDDLRDPGSLVSEPPVPRAFDAMAPPPLVRPTSDFEPMRPRDPRRSLMAAAAIGVVAGLALGLLVGYYLWAGLPGSSRLADTTARTLSTPGAPASVPVTAPPAVTPPAEARGPGPRVTPSAPKSIPAAPRATPKAAVPARIGRILVRSTPDAADVFVDGKRQGVTPKNLHDLPFGTYSIRVVRSGYVAQDRVVTLDERHASVRENFTLAKARVAKPAPPSGRAAGPAGAPASKPASAASAATGGPTAVVVATSISIESLPPGARVRIDGRDRGVTPLTISPVSPGPHVVALQLSGFRAWTTTVTVAAATRQRITASLERDTPR